MPKDPSPLLGYNNNIRHKNRVFHIQTEDSGVRHPHIITHLFMDGGRILKSIKTSYAEHLGVEKMADLVRKMMKDQHKGMLIALRDGQFDQVIDGGEAPKAAKKAKGEAEAQAPEAQVEDVQAAAAPEQPVEEQPPPTTAEPSGPEVDDVAAAPRKGPSEHLDIEDEREVTDAAAPAFEPQPSDLQPPPANLFRQRTGGNYSTVVNPPENAVEKTGVGSGSSRPQARPTGRPPSVRPGAPKGPSVPPGATVGRGGGTSPRQGSPRRGSSPPPAPVAPPPQRRPAPAVAVAKPAESRYASARPAAIFGQAKPRGGSSIFGEDIISDKSLDEVIMSYLAEDGPPTKATGGNDPKRRK